MRWLPLAQIAIGSALLVLFAVMLDRTQAQSRRLEQLERRLLTMENARALERTSALEEQLRTMLGRLRGLEASERRLTAQGQELQTLLDDLQQHQRPTEPSLLLPSPPAPPEAPPRRPLKPGVSPGQASPGVLRPPAADTP